MSIIAHQPIAGITCRLHICNYYILSSFSRCTTQTGKSYLRGVLSDASGRMAFVMWDDVTGLTDADTGKIVYVEGEAQEYRNAPQIKVDMLCLTTEDDIARIQMSDLVPYAPIDIQKAIDAMSRMLENLGDFDLAFFATFAFLKPLEDLMKVWPAAKAVHHAFVGGWTMHTYNMMCMAEAVYQQYGELYHINHDLLIVGTFLHDIGKLHEYDLTSQYLVQDYTVDGNLLGHPVLGVIMAEVAARAEHLDAETTRQLEHIIASHHGSRELSAAVLPQTIEAEIVHYLDGLDSRAEIYRTELDKTPVGKFSDFNRALEHAVYHHGKAS